MEFCCHIWNHHTQPCTHDTFTKQWITSILHGHLIIKHLVRNSAWFRWWVWWLFSHVLAPHKKEGRFEKLSQTLTSPPFWPWFLVASWNAAQTAVARMLVATCNCAAKKSMRIGAGQFGSTQGFSSFVAWATCSRAEYQPRRMRTSGWRVVKHWVWSKPSTCCNSSLPRGNRTWPWWSCFNFA